MVSDTLGDSAGFLLNHQNSPLPPTAGWEFWDPSKKARYDNDDTSLTLEFTGLSPSCQVVRVTQRQPHGETKKMKIQKDKKTKDKNT